MSLSIQASLVSYAKCNHAAATVLSCHAISLFKAIVYIVVSVPEGIDHRVR